MNNNRLNNTLFESRYQIHNDNRLYDNEEVCYETILPLKCFTDVVAYNHRFIVFQIYKIQICL